MKFRNIDMNSVTLNQYNDVCVWSLLFHRYATHTVRS